MWKVETTLRQKKKTTKQRVAQMGILKDGDNEEDEDFCIQKIN